MGFTDENHRTYQRHALIPRLPSMLESIPAASSAPKAFEISKPEYRKAERSASSYFALEHQGPGQQETLSCLPSWYTISTTNTPLECAINKLFKRLYYEQPYSRDKRQPEEPVSSAQHKTMQDALLGGLISTYTQEYRQSFG